MHIYAQNSVDKQQLKSEARVLFQSGNYYQAAQIYKSHLDYDSTQLDIAYAYAECNRHLLNYKNSEYWYTKVCLNDLDNDYLKPGFTGPWLKKIMESMKLQRSIFSIIKVLVRKRSF